tara:strand:+ start:1369 stop:2244 length:876 start_codon:yes stop_codon:yes gene_type:complete
MDLNFLEEIYEARMTRNSGDQRQLTYTDCGERLYLSLLILEVLRKYPSFTPIANGYARNTVTNNNYKHFRIHATDLYNLIYFVNGDEDAMNKLKDPASAVAMRKRTKLPIMRLNGYLHQVASGFSGSNSELFINIENALRINNSEYKAIRRQVANFNSLGMLDKKKVVTKLLLATRAKLRNSDLIPHLEELAAQRDLETGQVADNEPTISTPDALPTTNKDLMFYRYIVGPRNLVGTKKFLDMAKQGKSVPSPFVQAYLPAIQMLDDIVKAGPGYITMLRALQKRAKMHTK